MERDGFLARFQALEYTLAFVVGRRSLADFGVTSGVSIYRRDALEHALGSIHCPSMPRSRERGDPAARSRAHLLRRSPGGEHRGAGLIASLVLAAGGLVLRAAQVYTQRFHELWRIGRRAPFAMYNFIAYMGVLGLGLHLLRIVSAGLLLVSVGAILDNLFVFNLLPDVGAVNPVYFAGAVGSYLALGALALFTVVPKSERGYIAPIVPLYFLYVLMHIAPITVGFGNWLALRLWGRRLYRDHYQAHEDGAAPAIKGPGSRAAALRAPAAFR